MLVFGWNKVNTSVIVFLVVMCKLKLQSCRTFPGGP